MVAELVECDAVAAAAVEPIVEDAMDEYVALNLKHNK